MNNEKGFTLIELLIAIAVFSVVSTIVYSSFKNEIQAYVNQKKFSDAARGFRAVSYFLTMDFKTVGFDPVDSSDVKIEIAKKNYFSFLRINENFSENERLKRISIYKHGNKLFRHTQKFDSFSIVPVPLKIEDMASSGSGGVTEVLSDKISNFEIKYFDDKANKISSSGLDVFNKNSISKISSVEISLETVIDYWGKKSKSEKFSFFVQCRNLGI
jgi:prepilin-type N-terminal cleavage/methylation domain-containing protein